MRASICRSKFTFWRMSTFSGRRISCQPTHGISCQPTHDLSCWSNECCPDPWQSSMVLCERTTDAGLTNSTGHSWRDKWNASSGPLSLWDNTACIAPLGKSPTWASRSQETATPLGPPKIPGHSPYCRVLGGVVSYERGTRVPAPFLR